MQIFYLILAGLAAGVIGGMGMGGGTLLIPILVLFMKMDQRLAQSINLISFVPMAIISLIFHMKNKLIDYKVVLYMVFGGIAAGVLGAWLVRFVQAAILKKLFGGFIALLGLAQATVTVVKWIRAKKKKKKQIEE